MAQWARGDEGPLRQSVREQVTQALKESRRHKAGENVISSSLVDRLESHLFTQSTSREEYTEYATDASKLLIRLKQTMAQLNAQQSHGLVQGQGQTPPLVTPAQPGGTPPPFNAMTGRAPMPNALASNGAQADELKPQYMSMGVNAGASYPPPQFPYAGIPAPGMPSSSATPGLVPTVTTGPVGVMSNGAPLLLRGSRAWNTAPSTAPAAAAPTAAPVNPLRSSAGGPPPLTMMHSGAPGLMPSTSAPIGNGNVGAIPVNRASLIPAAHPAGPLHPPAIPTGPGQRGQGAVQMPGGPPLMMTGPPPGMAPTPAIKQEEAKPTDLGAPPILNTIASLLPSAITPGNADDSKKQESVKRHASWLLILKHSTRCPGKCSYGTHCDSAKELWTHMKTCKEPSCSHPRCKISIELLKHFSKCLASSCPICVPVRDVMKNQKAKADQMVGGPAPPPQPGGPPPPRPTLTFTAGGRSNASVQPSMPAVDPMEAERRRQLDEEELREAQLTAKRRKLAETAEYLGSSLLETFLPENIKVHVAALRSKEPLVRLEMEKWNQPVTRDNETCGACGQQRLMFDPLPLYCTSCSQRIVKGKPYWTNENVPQENRPYLCSGCYTELRVEIKVDDYTKISKASLTKKKVEEDQIEPWVQCDHCQVWVHQICGLFNKGRNDEELPYHCPQCLFQEFVEQKRRPIESRPQCFLEAKDLPRCKLSDYLEEHMARALDLERKQRAQAIGCPEHLVPKAEDLTIRVINNVDKKCEVRPRFLESYRDEVGVNEYKYKQKVILMTQKIEGVDVCLFVMYTQEYGEDCAPPNRRSCYLSYLDSVKYFRPEIESMDRGLQLRSFVYHELLIGYLDCLRVRGFNEMFIWACPPMQGDDYILYCHPSRQKNPKSDRLREWYLRMLRKALQDGAVHHLTNLYDRYFDGGKEHRLPEVSMARVPYYEGDYWPGEAENLLDRIGEETRQAGKKGAKGRPKTAQATKGKRGQGPLTTDEQLMSKLGETIGQMREDFIVVHFRPCCSFCRKYYDNEEAYFCPKEHPTATLTQAQQKERAAFSLCSLCYATEYQRIMSRQELVGRMAGVKALPEHIKVWEMVKVPMPALPSTADPDPDVECEIFESRSNFLSLCQGNHFQFDTIRRAKHSSMMIMYHLHNPDEPAFSSTCNQCAADIDPGKGWRCTVCPDFDLCDRCHHNVGHPHPMHHARQRGSERRERLSAEDVRERQRAMERWLLLLQHCANCQGAPACVSGSCRKFKQLLDHVRGCEQRNKDGGCGMCKKLLALIQHHARSCKNGIEECPVPFCNAIRQAHRAKLQRQEQQRRNNYKQICGLRPGAGPS